MKFTRSAEKQGLVNSHKIKLVCKCKRTLWYTDSRRDLAAVVECKFRCSNGRCIWDLNELCNGVNDCADFDDEIRSCSMYQLLYINFMEMEIAISSKPFFLCGLLLHPSSILFYIHFLCLFTYSADLYQFHRFAPFYILFATKVHQMLTENVKCASNETATLFVCKWKFMAKAKYQSIQCIPGPSYRWKLQLHISRQNSGKSVLFSRLHKT